MKSQPTKTILKNENKTKPKQTTLNTEAKESKSGNNIDYLVIVIYSFYAIYCHPHSAWLHMWILKEGTSNPTIEETTWW